MVEEEVEEVEIVMEEVAVEEEGEEEEWLLPLITRKARLRSPYCSLRWESTNWQVSSSL